MMSFPRSISVIPFSLLTLLVSAGLWGPPAAQAQHPTAVTSIVNSAEDTTLEVNHNGSLLMPGAVVIDGTGNDSIPAEGAGTRLMWYPAKAAFRAGRVGVFTSNSDVWDAGNVGAYSVAFGEDTRASGGHAAAMGDGTTASGKDATAMGVLTTASGLNATAMGRFTTASRDQATAMGLATTAATNQSLSIGECNDANHASSDGYLFVVGNGSFDQLSRTCTSNNDALALDNNGNLTTAGTVNGSSDRRLKRKIEPLSDCTIEALDEIRPVRFRFKDESTHPAGDQIGLIAQDVRTEFPELVRKESDGYLSLAYSRFTAVLLKGLQEQQVQIRDLKSENEAIRAKNEELQKRIGEIENLEKRLAALESRRSRSAVAGLPGSLLWGGALLLFLLGGGLATLLQRSRQ